MAFETTKLGKVNSGVSADRKDAMLNKRDLKHCKIQNEDWQGGVSEEFWETEKFGEKQRSLGS